MRTADNGLYFAIGALCVGILTALTAFHKTSKAIDELQTRSDPFQIKFHQCSDCGDIFPDQATLLEHKDAWSRYAR